MSEARTLSIPLDAETDTWAYLTVDWPLTETAWNQMLRALAAMKPGLVHAAEQPANNAQDVPDLRAAKSAARTEEGR